MLHARRLNSTCCFTPAAGLVAILLVAAWGSAASAQCPGAWATGAFSIGNTGMPNSVLGITTALDGSIYATGVFPSAGGTAAANIARWNGLWGPVGSGLNNTGWATLTMPNGDIIVGGQFTTAGGIAANRIARWNGSAWSALGTGLNDIVYALAVKPNNEIIAAGQFTSAGGFPASKIARWNGSSWISLGTGVDLTVYAVTVLTNGDVVAGGVILNAGGNPVSHIARFDGSNWLPLSGPGGEGVDGTVRSLLPMADGSVIVGGFFSTAGGINARNVARWTPAGGGAWFTMGNGLGNEVWALRQLKSGTIVAGGTFITDGTFGGTPINHISRWDGTAWQPLGVGTSDTVRCITGTNFQSDTMYLGGTFTTAGGATAVRIAQFNASATSSITIQPVATVEKCGTTARFITDAAAAPVTYQWRRNGVNLTDGGGGGAVSGATSRILTISPATAVHAGSYDCVISWTGGGCGATTAAASLTVTDCCPADFDNSGDITPSDIANFVNSWFSALNSGC